MYCCPMNIAPISEPKTMMPATAATQKVGRAATLRSYSGFLARRCRKTNSTTAIDRDDEQAHGELLVTGHGQEVDREDERPDEDHREDAAEVIHRLGRLVDVRGDEFPAP